jgi:hypothetical protein
MNPTVSVAHFPLLVCFSPDACIATCISVNAKSLVDTEFSKVRPALHSGTSGACGKTD